MGNGLPDRVGLAADHSRHRRDRGIDLVSAATSAAADDKEIILLHWKSPFFSSLLSFRRRFEHFRQLFGYLFADFFLLLLL